jgi:transcriptional regulator with XRE-family HTH domain
MKFGDNLKNIRKSKKISQEDLADKLGVSRQSISKWETGENYPSMQNIVCLCSIFKCKMNDLVHESFDDIDFMDEDIKMSVVKLNEKEQTNMKFLSNILFMTGRIGKIVLRVGVGFIVFAMILIAIFLPSLEVKDDKIISKDEVVKITETEYGLEFASSKNKHVRLFDINISDVNKVKHMLTKFDKTTLMILSESILVFLAATLIVVSLALDKLEKLFANIHDGNTPFTIDNVNYMKKMAIYLIVSIILLSLSKTILGILTIGDYIFDFNLLNIIEIFFIYSMALVFEYGYRIQKDSKGKMYNETKED